MPAPTPAAVSRMRRIRSSGSKGWPWTIPSAAIFPVRSGSSAPAGSSWMIVSISSKKPMSLEWVPLNDTPAKFRNSISGGASAAASG